MLTDFDQGKQARKRGDTATAIQCFQETIRRQPDFVPAYNNLANALQAQGDYDGAIALYQQALQRAPNMAVLHCNLASLRQLQGQAEPAIAGFQQAIALQPDFFLAHYNLGKVWAAQGRFTLAERSYRTALRLKPDYAEAYLDCGQLYHSYGFVPKAVNCYRAALRARPSARAYNSLGAALQEWGSHDLAKRCYLRALKLQPEFDLPHFNLAQLAEPTDLSEARRHYEHALALKPGDVKLLYHLEAVRRKQADWSDYPQRLTTLREATEKHLRQEQSEPLPPMTLLSWPLPLELMRAVAALSARHYAKLARDLAASFTALTDPNPVRLKIGYVSPDFRCHAVGTLIADLFQYHDRAAFEVYAYSLTPPQDEWSERVHQGCDHFLDASHLPALTLAERIHADGIHILIDLAGYTTHSRTLLFALKPAPVQVQYLGYPGTMGAEFIPYLLADRQLIPENDAPRYSEEVMYLPHAWASAPMSIADATPTRHDCGLPDTAVVYACFNGHYKIEPTVFAAWMDILRQTPNSVLWLSDGGDSNDRLRAHAQAAGIDPTRLIFAEKRAHADYLAYYRLADLFLDTFVYNAGATAVGALSAGLPLLTCPGEHYAARMGAGLCQAVGLPELICASADGYVARAVAYGTQPDALAALKQRLASTLPEAPLFQPQTFIADLEHALHTLWQRLNKQR